MQTTGPSIVRAEIEKYPHAVTDAVGAVESDEGEALEAPLWEVLDKILVHVPPELGREALSDEAASAIGRFAQGWAFAAIRRYQEFLVEEDTIEEDEPPAGDAA